MKVLLLNGPNLNLLGEREPSLYGHTSLEEVVSKLQELGARLGVEVHASQSNHEGVLIDHLHAARACGSHPMSGIIINPGALTHTSIAIRDAISAICLPTIEVHLTQTASREPFRHHSYLSDVVLGTVSGFGVYGYELALRAMKQHLSTTKELDDNSQP